MQIESPIFEWMAEALEGTTGLNRLQARGTVRLALRKAGLEAATVTREEMQLVLDLVLPKELMSRGVSDTEDLCRGLADSLRDAKLEDAQPAHQTAGEIFGRLFGEPRT